MSAMDPIEVREEIIRPVVDVLGGGEAAVMLVWRTGLAEIGISDGRADTAAGPL